MRVERYGGTGIASNCYLLTDDAAEHALLIDPSVTPEELAAARRVPIPPLTAILLTHAHFDHMLAVDAWRKEGSIPLCVGAQDADALGDANKNAYRLFYGTDKGTASAEHLLSDGERIMLGEEAVTVFSTPGHTPGSLCLYASGVLISGDTLFASSIGRDDLPGGDGTALSVSLARLMTLPEETAVYPGHGPVTSIGREKKYNPYL